MSAFNDVGTWMTLKCPCSARRASISITSTGGAMRSGDGTKEDRTHAGLYRLIGQLGMARAHPSSGQLPRCLPLATPIPGARPRTPQRSRHRGDRLAVRRCRWHRTLEHVSDAQFHLATGGEILNLTEPWELRPVDPAPGARIVAHDGEHGCAGFQVGDPVLPPLPVEEVEHVVHVG